MPENVQLAVYRWPRRLLRPAILDTQPFRLHISRGTGPKDLSSLPHGGWYDRIAGWLLLLHRRDSRLWLNATRGATLSLPLDELSSQWRNAGRTPFLFHVLGLGRRSSLTLSRRGAPVFSLAYRRISWDVPHDNTPFRDPEFDDDFVLFIHTLIQDRDRQNGVMAAMSAAA